MSSSTLNDRMSADTIGISKIDKKKLDKELEEYRRTGKSAVSYEDLDFSNLGKAPK